MQDYVQAALSGQGRSGDDVPVKDVPRHDQRLVQATKTTSPKPQAAERVWVYTDSQGRALMQCLRGGTLARCKVGDDCKMQIVVEEADEIADPRQAVENGWLHHVLVRHKDEYAACNQAVSERREEESKRRHHGKKAASPG